MKKLSLLLIVLFVLFGCTSAPKKDSTLEKKAELQQTKVAVTQQTPESGEFKQIPIMPGLTFKDILNAFEASDLPLEIIKRDRDRCVWEGDRVIKRDSGELTVRIHIIGYSENEVEAVYLSIDESKSTHSIQSFEVEVSEIFSRAAKIPIEGVDNSKVEKWIKDTLEQSEKTSFFVDNSIGYRLINAGDGSSKMITIVKYK